MSKDDINDYVETESTLTISKDRMKVALEATWEMEVISDKLISTLVPIDGGEHLFQRALFHRMREIARIAMSAIGDENEKVHELQARLG